MGVRYHGLLLTFRLHHLAQFGDWVRALGLVPVVAVTFAARLVDHDLARCTARVHSLLVREVPVIGGQVIERHVVQPVSTQVVLRRQHLSHVLLVRFERHGRVGERRRQDLFRLDAFVSTQEIARDLQLSELHVEVQFPQGLDPASVSSDIIDQ